eukprot:1053661-Prymnesium_polylepis.3
MAESTAIASDAVTRLSLCALAAASLRVQPAADTPDPCAGGSVGDSSFMRDPACSTPSPPALASDAPAAGGVQHAPMATAAVLTSISC